MTPSSATDKRHPLARIFGWKRLRFTLYAGLIPGLLFSGEWLSGPASILIRTVGLALIGLIVFGVLEQWPKRLPSWLARWVLQVVAVALSMPLATFGIYVLSTEPGAPPFWEVPDRMEGFSALAGLGLFLAPWMALAALVRQKEAIARHQALAFELERSELERQAIRARLSLLQAQVAPHFLFNTLANVQALVDSGSPKASALLRSLTAYLRAAIPQLDDQATTLGQELDLVRAYLELMHMRMPDRLQYALHVDPCARSLPCPPITVLTLVENAVHHGIDPSEEGGRIDVHVERSGNRCVVRVRDTGVGLQETNDGLGTGLSTLRERLVLIFGGEAELRVTEAQTKGVCAELVLPTHKEAG